MLIRHEERGIGLAVDTDDNCASSCILSDN
jgi:hypothetical protein